MRIEPKRTQRFYYPAGAISLILLPVICICYFRNHRNDRQDQMQLEAARMGVRNLVRSKDTLTGIHFHFDDRAAFWTLIKAFEICKTENSKAWLPYENDLWVFNTRPERKVEEEETEYYPVFTCGTTGIDMPPSEEEMEQLQIEKRNELIKYYAGMAQQYFPSLLLLSLMIFLTRRKVRQLKKNCIPNASKTLTQ